MSKEYSVVVGNIGRVYTGTCEFEAKGAFESYVAIACGHVGKASNETVVLELDGEIEIEFNPQEFNTIKSQYQQFFESYIATALTLCGSYEKEVALQEESEEEIPDFTVENLTTGALVSLELNCFQFALLVQRAGIVLPDYSDAGVDFWLTQNGHETGFWDNFHKPYTDEEAEKLTAFSNQFRECDLYSALGKIHYT